MSLSYTLLKCKGFSNDKNEKHEIPPVFDREISAFPELRNLWRKIYHPKIYQKMRHSMLNPYRWGLKNIDAETFERAVEIARSEQKIRFIYENEVCSAELKCPVYKECEMSNSMGGSQPILRGSDKKPDVRDRIPRNENGELDLFAEKPIIFAIVPITRPGLVGHVGMEYDGHVMNRLISSIHTDPLLPKYQEYTEYFFVYPSKIGTTPQDVIDVIDEHNIAFLDKKYNLFNNNCAKNTADILKKLGVKDLDLVGPDKLGIVFANPGNNPFGTGIKNWCRKHGVHVTPEDVEKTTSNVSYPDNKKYRDYVRAEHNRRDQKGR